MVKIADFLHQMCLCITTQIHFIREFTDLTISERRFTESNAYNYIVVNSYKVILLLVTYYK